MSHLDLRSARGQLGTQWGLGRPLTMSEMGRALRLQGKDPGSTVRDWEQRGTASGPVTVAIEMMLAGAAPPDPLNSIVRDRS